MPAGDPLRRAGRHRGLAHDKALALQVRGERADHGVDLSEVGSVLTVLLRRPGTDEMNVPEVARFLVRRGEPDAAGLEVLAQQRFEPWLEERHLARGQRGDLALVDVETEYVEAQLGHADGVGGAEVTGSENSETHRMSVTNGAKSGAGVVCSRTRPGEAGLR